MISLPFSRACETLENCLSYIIFTISFTVCGDVTHASGPIYFPRKLVIAGQGGNRRSWMKNSSSLDFTSLLVLQPLWLTVHIIIATISHQGIHIKKYWCTAVLPLRSCLSQQTVVVFSLSHPSENDKFSSLFCVAHFTTATRTTNISPSTMCFFCSLAAADSNFIRRTRSTSFIVHITKEEWANITKKSDRRKEHKTSEENLSAPSNTQTPSQSSRRAKTYIHSTRLGEKFTLIFENKLS